MTSGGEGGTPEEVLEILNFHLVNSPLGVVEWDHEFRVSRGSSRCCRERWTCPASSRE